MFLINLVAFTERAQLSFSKTKFDQINKGYMHNPEFVLENSLGFWDTNRSFNLGQMIRPSDNQQKKKRKEEKKREPAKKENLPFHLITG